MKIKIEIDEGLPEDEVLIRCRGLTEQISDVQKAVSEVINTSQKFVFYRGNTEYYLTLDEILFFETDSDGINAHTRDNIYQTKYKLYELEELLPGSFMRISKSAIVNTSHIYSISRNLTASSVVAFADTHKQVYVSRYYYKPLINKLEVKEVTSMKLRKNSGKILWGLFFILAAVYVVVKQTLDHAGDQCVQCFIDGILYLALFKWYPQCEFLGNPVFHRIYMYHI